MGSNRLRMAVALSLALLAAGNAGADFSFIYNGHTYQFIQENRAWLSATSAAKARTVAGSPGYPAQINNLQDAAGISLDGWPLGVAGQWNDVNETNTLYYLAEFNAVPEPSVLGCAFLLLALRRRRRLSRTKSYF